MKHIISKKFRFLFLGFALVTLFASCEADDPVADDSGLVNEDMLGTWVVNMTWDGEPQGQTTIATYNTSANDGNAMWLDDLEHGWGLKTKVNVDQEANTFSGTGLEELYYDVTVDITEGQIIKDAVTTPSGEVVDSIYFKAEFSDIPGEIWEYAGYKSTGKVEDLP